MSRIGKNPVDVPAGVEIAIKGGLVSAKGTLGSLDFRATRDVEISQADGKVWVKPAIDSTKARAMWGTARPRIQYLSACVTERLKKEQRAISLFREGWCEEVLKQVVIQ